MHKPDAIPNDTEAPAHYLFIVARDRPEILDRVKERLRGDFRIEVITDRRYGERRTSVTPSADDRRRAERRRPTKHWDDLSVYPTLVVQKRVDSYAQLQEKLAASVRDAEDLRDDNARLHADNAGLREEIARLDQQLQARMSADAAFRAEAATILTQAEQAVGAMIGKFEALARAHPRESRSQVSRG